MRVTLIQSGGGRMENDGGWTIHRVFNLSSPEEVLVCTLEQLGKTEVLLVQTPQPEELYRKLALIVPQYQVVEKTGWWLVTPGAKIFLFQEAKPSWPNLWLRAGIKDSTEIPRVIPLETQVGELCQRQGVRLATAESCTGGLLAARLTDVPGSSLYFWGGVVTYSLEAKGKVLDISPALLTEHGAVSPQIAAAMAEGARAKAGAHIGLGITGLAGPGGDGSGKKVGLVYLALASASGTEVREVWCSTGSRYGNKLLATEAALWWLRNYLQGEACPLDHRGAIG